MNVQWLPVNIVQNYDVCFDFVAFFLCICNICSLPKLYASHLLIIAVRFGGCVGDGTHIASLIHQGSKRSLWPGKSQRFSGWLSGILFWSTFTAEGCCLATRGQPSDGCLLTMVFHLKFAALPNFVISSH